MRRATALALTLPLLTLAPPLSAQADSTPGRNIRFAYSLGLSSTTLNAADGPGWADRRGAVPGLELSIPLTTHVSLVPTLLHVRKGVRFVTPLGDRQSIDRNYLELPVLLRVDLPARWHVAPFVSGGAAVAYQTGCWVDAADASVVAPRMTCRSYDRSPFSGGPIERRRVDASALVGGGVTVPAAGRRLRLSALYDRSVRRTDPAIPTEHRAWYYLASVEW